MLNDTTNAATPKRTTEVMRWIAQILLSALFLFAGGMKLIVPVDVMQQQSDLPGAFILFIGVVEVLGGLGLVLPGLLKMRSSLTALAAAGLLIIMLGATILTAATAGISGAVVPLVTGLMCGFVAYGRSGSRLTLRRATSGPSSTAPVAIASV